MQVGIFAGANLHTRTYCDRLGTDIRQRKEKAMEQWKWVVGWEGYYRVSNTGRVMTVGSAHPHWLNPAKVFARQPRVHAPHTNKRGYRHILLQRHGQKVDRTVHSLVLEAFHGPRPHGLVCNHKNGKRSDNRASNLEWVTHKQNIRHAWDMGLAKAYDRSKA